MVNAASTPCAGRAEAVRLFACEAPLNLIVVDLDMRFVAASPVFLANIGLTLDQVLGLTIHDLLPGTEAGLAEIVSSLAEDAPRFSVTRPARLPDGKIYWFKTDGSYWRDDSGEVAGYIMTNQEITAEREAEAARREMEVLLRAVIDNIPSTVVVQDLETERFVLVNRKVAETLGRSPDELIGLSPADFLSGDALSVVKEQTATLRENGRIHVAELASPAGGRDRTLRMTRLQFDDGSGHQRMLSIGEDITDLHDATRALEAAVAEAEAANAAKSRFLANVSHEIRTPLNGVLGMAQAMAQAPLPRAQRERLEVIRQSGETLLSLLNDLLDLSKIEAGRIEFEVLDFDLADVVRSACAPFRVLAEQRGVAFELAVPDDDGLRRGDPTRLRQLVVNLVSNAVKFTEEGRIDVAVSHDADGITLTVDDTGIGMSSQTLATMFEKFTQGDISTTRRFGGTGLGLAICHDLVELMGGRIEVESEPDRGTRFGFTLPLPRVARPDVAPLAAAEAERPRRDAARAPRVLAAEDNATNQLVLSTLLKQVGVEVSVVGDGAEAVAAWEREPWDAILMDVHMPVMDGIQATATIRAREAAEGRARTPIIALTADAMAHHMDGYRASGMDAVVAKPIQLQALLNALDAVLTAAPPDDEADRRAIGRRD